MIVYVVTTRCGDPLIKMDIIVGIFSTEQSAILFMEGSCTPLKVRSYEVQS